MGWSKSNLSLNSQRFVTFALMIDFSPKNEMFSQFCLAVCPVMLVASGGKVSLSDTAAPHRSDRITESAKGRYRARASQLLRRLPL